MEMLRIGRSGERGLNQRGSDIISAAAAGPDSWRDEKHATSEASIFGYLVEWARTMSDALSLLSGSAGVVLASNKKKIH